VQAKAEELQFLARALFRQQNTMNEVTTEQISSHTEEPIVDPSFLQESDNISCPDAEWMRSLDDEVSPFLPYDDDQSQ
jgi:hypothetical protein